nr:MAG: hypothetical protein [Skomarfal virus 29]
MSPLGFSWGRKGPRTPRRPRAPTTQKRTWGAKAPRTPTVRKLATQVAKIARTVKGTTSDVVYGTGFNNPIGNVGGTNTYVFPLSQYSTWNRIFGTDADDESNHKALWKKSQMDFQIETNGERNLIDYAFYIVSLTRLGMEELFTPASGGLAGPQGITPPVNGVHFYYNNIQGMTILNKKYFNIHTCRRMRSGSQGSLATDTADLSKRWYVSLNHNGGKGHLLQNPKGDWKAIPSPQLAGQNLYVLLFNNDSTVDQSVYFKMSGIHSLTIS